MAFKVSDPLGLLTKPVNGAPSLQPEGLRPATSLSTLNSSRYRQEPKTRYGIRWVGAFPVALSATSGSALRGAPENRVKVDSGSPPTPERSCARMSLSPGADHDRGSQALGSEPEDPVRPGQMQGSLEP